VDDYLHYTHTEDMPAAERTGLEWATQRAPRSIPSSLLAGASAKDSTDGALEPAADAAWHASVRQRLGEVAACSARLESIAPLDAGFEETNGGPSRRQLLALVSNLQEQITCARERQDDLNGALRTAQGGSVGMRSSEPPPPTPLPSFAAAPPTRAFLGGSCRSPSWPAHLAAPQRCMAEGFHGSVGEMPIERVVPLPTAVSMYGATQEGYAAAYAQARPATTGAYSSTAEVRHDSRVHADERLQEALATPYRPTPPKSALAWGHPEQAAATPHSAAAGAGHRRTPLAQKMTPPRCGLSTSAVTSGAALPVSPPAPPLAAAEPFAVGLGSTQTPLRAATHVPMPTPARAVDPVFGAQMALPSTVPVPVGMSLEETSGVMVEVARLQAQLQAMRLASDTSEGKVREAMAARLEAERLAADAARSSAAASRAAEDLRSELVGARRLVADAVEERDLAKRRTNHLEAEVTTLRAHLRGKYADEQHLHGRLAELTGTHAQREHLWAHKEAEMRSMRQRALAMVQAMRGATGSLSAHSHAHALLEGHFRSLEGSLNALPAEGSA